MAIPVLLILLACSSNEQETGIDVQVDETPAGNYQCEPYPTQNLDECKLSSISVVEVADCSTECGNGVCLPGPTCMFPGPACVASSDPSFFGLYRTCDAGRHWKPVLFHSVDEFIAEEFWASPLEEFWASPMKVVFDPTASERAYAATANGVYRTRDYGEHWEQVLPTVCKLIRIHPSTGRIVAVEYDKEQRIHRLHRSDDQGETWASFPVCLAGKCSSSRLSGMVTSMAISPSSDGLILLGGRFDDDSVFLGSKANIVRSTDGGSTWTMSGTEMQEVTWRVGKLAFAPSEPQRVYATISTASTLFVSHDAGGSWEPLPEFGDHARSFLLIDPANADHLWRGGSNSKLGPEVFESTIGGRAWRGFEGSRTLGFDAIALNGSLPTWAYRTGARLDELEHDAAKWCPEGESCDFSSGLLAMGEDGEWHSAQCGLPVLEGYDAYFTTISQVAVHPMHPELALASIQLSFIGVDCD